MKIVAIIACLVALTIGMNGSAAADDCDCPPSNALSKSTTKDAKWRSKWCNDQSVMDALWFGLNLDETGDLWDEGWGYEDVCNDNLFLSRLYNAGFIVREVEKIAQHFPETNSPNAGHKWWDFVHDNEDDGYEPKCCNDNLDPDECCLWATHYCCNTSTDLCLLWAFNRGAADRSSTLVHEATHEDVGHISDDDCPNDGSCDPFYGGYYANTMQINYSYDAAAAYQIVTVNNKTRRQVVIFQVSGKQMCRYKPLLEEDERNILLADVKDRLDNNFKWGSVFANYANAAGIDAAKGTPWECANCKTSDYTFSPETFGDNKACNEITNKQNVAVNEAKRAACQLFNVKVGFASGAAAYGEIKDELDLATTGKCKPCSKGDTDAYCLAQQAIANHVDELDPYGMLSSCGYSYETGCLRSYCQAKFLRSWSTHANDPSWDDPRGCLDAVCGDDALCRKRFLTYGGDPKYYDPDTCTRALLECYESKGKKVAVTTGGPGPVEVEIPECTLKYDMCKLAEAIKRKVMGMLLVKKWILPGDPVIRQNPWEYSATEMLRSRLIVLRSRRDNKTLSESEFEREIEEVMAHRESMAVAFSLEPQVFVYLFGRDRLEGLVGPSIRVTAPRAPLFTDLDVGGRILLKQLQQRAIPR